MVANKDIDPNQLGPTRLRDLAAVAVITTTVVWLVVRAAYGHLPPIPTVAGGALYIIAIIELVIAFSVRSRVSDRNVGISRGQLHPITAARLAALAKASSILGAFAIGVWGGLSVYLGSERDMLAAAQRDLPGAIIGVVGAVFLVGAALWLEYCCRTPDDPSDEAVS